MACLLPCSKSAASSQQCIAAASRLLQEALRATLGLPQPRLLNLMQVGCCIIALTPFLVVKTGKNCIA